MFFGEGVSPIASEIDFPEPMCDSNPSQKKRPHESVDYVQHRHRKLKVKGGAQSSQPAGKLGAVITHSQQPPSAGPIVVSNRKKCPKMSVNSPEKLPPGANFTASLIERSTEIDRNNIKYTAYSIEVQQSIPNIQNWKIQRRYRDFVEFRVKLRRCRFNNVGKLPPKTWTKHTFDEVFLGKRQDALAKWIEDTLAQHRAGANHVTAGSNGLSSPVGEKELAGINECIRGFLVDSYGYKKQGILRADAPLSDCIIAPPLPSNVQGAENEPGNEEERPSIPIAAVALTNFELLKVLGKGSYGKVILVRKKCGHDAGALYAMKVLKKEHVMKKKQVAHTKTERSVLGTIRHPFIVRLHYAFQTGEKLHFVLDYCSGGELFFHLQKHGRFPPKLALFYTAELSLALGELHSHGIVYRDMKPENILLDDVGHVQLADFGLSKEGIKSGEKGTRSFCGTPEYLAPEVLERKGHGFAVDWWALGALLYEMITGLPPWYSRDRQKMFASIRAAPLVFPGYVVGDLKEFITEFLVRDPKQRLGGRGEDVIEVRDHLIFRFVNWDALLRRETKPPWKPPATNSFMNSYDTSNFETSFTNLPVQSLGSSLPNELNRVERAQSATNGAFEGFTYVDESVLLSDNFRQKLDLDETVHTSVERQE
jgi:serine/threonine protein kinase